MTPENQSLVRDSFAKVEPITLQAAAMFYDRLFVLDPSLKPLFKSDMTEQGRMLMAMIGTVAANLGNLETIRPCKISADATRPMGSNPGTTRLLELRCSGRSSKVWAMLSHSL
jgi:hemoglobin-like flavoprotein